MKTKLNQNVITFFDNKILRILILVVTSMLFSIAPVFIVQFMIYFVGFGNPFYFLLETPKSKDIIDLILRLIYCCSCTMFYTIKYEDIVLSVSFIDEFAVKLGTTIFAVEDDDER